MTARQSDEYADLLASTKLDQLLEASCQAGGEFASMREHAEALVAQSAGCEFLISKGQLRITFDLRPSTPPAEIPAPDPE
jgi:hypothetical protein